MGDISGQSLVGHLTITNTLGSSPLGALGTDTSVVFFSTNPGVGFGPENNAILGFDTYAGVPAIGGNGEAILVIQDFTNDSNPAYGAKEGNVYVGVYGNPPPPVNVEWQCDFAITCTGTNTSGQYVGNSIFYNFSTSAVDTLTGHGTYTAVSYENVIFAVNNAEEYPINCLLGITIQEDEAIVNSIEAYGTLYVNSGATGDTGEALILNQPAPTFNQPIPLTGLNVGPVASSLVVSQDGTSAGTLTSFDAGLMWSGTGAIGKYGTHTLFVTDPVSNVQSNTVTYTLAEPEGAFFLGLFQSDVIPSSSSNYTEFNNQLEWTFQTSLLPDNKDMANNAMIYAMLDLQFVGAQPSVAINFLDSSNSTTLASTSIAPSGTNTVWGSFLWGEAPWGGTAQQLAPNWVQWGIPVVFKQGYFEASGLSEQGFAIGAIYMEYQITGYVQQYYSGVS